MTLTIRVKEIVSARVRLQRLKPVKSKINKRSIGLIERLIWEACGICDLIRGEQKFCKILASASHDSFNSLNSMKFIWGKLHRSAPAVEKRHLHEKPLLQKCSSPNKSAV